MYQKLEIKLVNIPPVNYILAESGLNLPISLRKRLFDLIFSLMSILILLPFYLIISIITYISSKGPVLYKQERIGINDKPFKIYKFRSMYLGAEKNGPELSKNNDPRVTPWGSFMRKYRIDEFPQFFNVFFGSMSIVGPRPEREYWKYEIEKETLQYNKLSKVKPGITSLGQVKFGYAENVDEMQKRLRFDLLYLGNISLLLDIKIILMTVMVILQGEGK
ncbi:MAG: sugar transferase [Bacteroidetes bacterium]|nr:MAG: sugar transferase [Bacteroidota bacterium]